jgi:hypothetical protein
MTRSSNPLVATIADQVVPAILPATVDSMRSTRQPLPMPDLSALPQDQSLVYATSRIDTNGVLVAGHLLDTLGWKPGDRISSTISNHLVLFRRELHAPTILSRKRSIHVPSSARHACGIRSGTTLLLAAAPFYDLLVLHPESAVHQMMVLFHRNVASYEH